MSQDVQRGERKARRKAVETKGRHSLEEDVTNSVRRYREFK